MLRGWTAGGLVDISDDHPLASMASATAVCCNGITPDFVFQIVEEPKCKSALPSKFKSRTSDV
jgi:hypothetical protein